MTISVDILAVIHIAQMLLHHRDFAQNLRQIPDLHLERHVVETKLGLVVGLLVAAPAQARAQVLGDFGQVQPQEDCSVTCSEVEGKIIFKLSSAEIFLIIVFVN